MDFNRLDQQLRDSLADLRLSNEERDELRQLGSDLGQDQVRYLRNRAFALVRELVQADLNNSEPALKWLEQVVKTLDASSSPARPALASAHFSPGDDCHRRGIAVRVISDNEKQFDEGSDIQHLIAQGVPLRIDDSPYHMHHKFALFDANLLLNGSFNWTRSATTSNEENLLVTDHALLVASYRSEFDKLWARFAR